MRDADVPAGLWVVQLGRMPYGEALEIQRAVARARISGDIDQDVLLLVEHPPVVTLGRSSKEGHVVAAPDFLQSRGVEVFEVERGGDVTFHGPGQLVAYPILDLKRHRQDLHWYLRQLEEVVIRTLESFGLAAERREKFTGVWTGGRKIASIGVHTRDWVTWHGFALNVTTDLSYFNIIVPCGINDVVMTSIARETGEDISFADAERATVSAFAKIFELAPESCDLEQLGLLPAAS